MTSKEREKVCRCRLSLNFKEIEYQENHNKRETKKGK